MYLGAVYPLLQHVKRTLDMELDGKLALQRVPATPPCWSRPPHHARMRSLVPPLVKGPRRSVLANEPLRLHDPDGDTGE